MEFTEPNNTQYELNNTLMLDVHVNKLTER